MSQTQKKREYSADVAFGKAYDADLVRRLWPFVRPYRLLLFAALSTYPFVSVLHLLQPWLVKIAIDQHLVPKQAEGFQWVIGGLLLAAALEFAARFAQTFVTQILGQRVTHRLRKTLFAKLQKVDLAYVERNPVGRMMTRVTNDVESLSEMFSTGAVSIIGDIMTLTGVVIAMLVMNAKLTLYSFCVLPLILLVVQFFRQHARAAFRDVRSLLARLNGFLNEHLNGMRVVQIFVQEKVIRREFDDVNRAYRNANFRAIRFDAMTYAVVEGISTIAIAAMLVLGASLFIDDGVQVGVFVAFVEYLRRFFGPITELSSKYTVMQSAMASAERCVDLLDQEATILAPDSPAPPPPVVETISFREVGFSYRDGEPVLRGLNLEIRRGEKVAIVGATGSGKSTVVKLLARFYDPQEGLVSFNGLPLPSMSPADLRSKLAVVLQDAYLFDGSIRNNVTLGDPSITESALAAAATRSRAASVVERQERGWEAGVGERGGRLSAGERQLVAFARALVRNPEVLILDEATSSVDPETEALIQEGLEALIENRTALIIAHRLSTIRRVDRIVVMSHGQIIEQGSHETLLSNNGAYRRLYELQFAEAEA